MGAMTSQITGLMIVYSTFYEGADQRYHQSSASMAFVRGIHRVTGEFPAQMASYAENVSIWWRHHDYMKNRVLVFHDEGFCVRIPSVGKWYKMHL